MPVSVPFCGIGPSSAAPLVQLAGLPSPSESALKAVPGMCHQWLVREREAASTPAPAIDLDVGKATVRPISFAEAREVIQRFEYLRTMPARVLHCFGIFFGKHLGGVVVYAYEASENLGVWDKFDFTGRIVSFARGASLPWAPMHTASRLIRASMKLLPTRLKVVTATVDRQAGEVGTIYQACGFAYVGVMRSGGRVLIRRHDGSVISGREARRRFGTENIATLRRIGVEAVPVARRARYFCFR